jgi:hypothetical protein
VSLNDKDLDESMAADWAAIQDKYAGEDPETPEPITEPETAPEPVVAEPEAPTRARDETGKFSKETAKPIEKAAVKGAPAKEPVAPEPMEAVTPEITRDINRAPSTWKPAARVDFEKLPANARAEIHRREADYMNGQAQLLPDAKFGKSITEIMTPYKMLIEAEGGTYERAIADMMKTAAMLRMGTPQQKQQLFLQTAQQFGIDLRQFQAQPGQQQQPLQDPRVDQLLAQLNQERQQRVQTEQQSLEGAVTSWMGENDAQGKPLRPYLGDVMTEMSALVPQIRTQSPSLSHDQVLQQAYERATWGNPEIRTLLLQQQAQGASQTRSADNQQRVREAKRAASVNVPRRASLPTPGKPGTLEETIANTARELGLIT